MDRTQSIGSVQSRSQLTFPTLSDTLSDMTVNSREFQRNFPRMKAAAVKGETVTIISDGQEFIFRAAKPRTWQGALKGKMKIKGDIFSTGIEWEASK
jgi:hypothetical protein